MDRMIIGSKIREARLAKKMTISQLAEQCGISSNFIGNLERGLDIPSVKTLIKLSECLGVGFDYLLSYHEREAKQRCEAVEAEIYRMVSDMPQQKKLAVLECIRAIQKL